CASTDVVATWHSTLDFQKVLHRSHAAQRGQLVVGEQPPDAVLALEGDPQDLPGVDPAAEEVLVVADPVQQRRKVQTGPNELARRRCGRQGLALTPASAHSGAGASPKYTSGAASSPTHGSNRLNRLPKQAAANSGESSARFRSRPPPEAMNANTASRCFQTP